MVETKLHYTPPSAEAIAEIHSMSLLNSLSSNLNFEDLDDGGEYTGTEIEVW